MLPSLVQHACVYGINVVALTILSPNTCMYDEQPQCVYYCVWTLIL